MIKRSYYISLFLIVCVLAGLFFSLGWVRASDCQEFQSYLDRGVEIKNQSKAHHSPVDQLRENVQKDIWYIEDGHREHMKLFSAQSNLTLILESGKLKLIEKLSDLECWVQDQLYLDSNGNPRQKIRHFTSDDGVYTFPSHRFLTKSVALDFSDEPGHDLPKNLQSFKPFIYGFAQEVSFDLSGVEPLFSAKHLKVHLDPGKSKPMVIP